MSARGIKGYARRMDSFSVRKGVAVRRMELNSTRIVCKGAQILELQHYPIDDNGLTLRSAYQIGDSRRPGQSPEIEPWTNFFRRGVL
jgi:hypothetical protein